MSKFYFDGFWPGFQDFEKKFIMNLFVDGDVCLENPASSDYVITSIFNLKELYLKKSAKWIHMSFEPISALHPRQNLAIVTYKHEGSFYLPFVIFYLHLRGYMEPLLSPAREISIPKKFCCFLSSSAYGLPESRKKIFEKLSSYKKVDSWGSHLNNMGEKLSIDYHSPQFLQFLSQYKFMIAFENRKVPGYVTEKLVNPMLAGIIPIYWGALEAKELFNPERFLYVDDIDNLEPIINQIIDLDKDDSKYLEMINQPNVVKDNDLFHLNKIQDNIRSLL